MTEEQAKEITQELATIRRRVMPTPLRNFASITAAVFIGTLSALVVWELANLYFGSRVIANLSQPTSRTQAKSIADYPLGDFTPRDFERFSKEIEVDVRAGQISREQADSFISTYRTLMQR